jgi:hypothetical protein
MSPLRIMYVEHESCENTSVPGLVGVARIGRVTFSKTGRTIYYNAKSFQSLNGTGFKANFYNIESGEEYWISGPKKNGADGLYGPRPTPIDPDVREQYWTIIRKQPSKVHHKST